MRKLEILFLLASVALGCRAQDVAMRDVFRQMPDSVVPYLSQTNKLDMVDFIDSGMRAEVNNLLDGHSVLDTLTNGYLRLRLTPATLVEMKLLPLSKPMSDGTKQVVCMVTMFGDTHKATAVDFYTTDWRKTSLDAPLNRTLEKVSASLAADSAMDANWADIVPTVRLSPSSSTIQIDVAYTFMPDEQGRKHEPIMRSLTMEWDGTGFK